jgi:hypothetical protein
MHAPPIDPKSKEEIMATRSGVLHDGAALGTRSARMLIVAVIVIASLWLTGFAVGRLSARGDDPAPVGRAAVTQLTSVAGHTPPQHHGVVKGG